MTTRCPPRRTWPGYERGARTRVPSLPRPGRGPGRRQCAALDDFRRAARAPDPAPGPRAPRAPRAVQWWRPSLPLAVARLKLGRRALTLATGLSASVPVIVATVNAVRDSWVPGADQGIIATRAYDVFTSHAPLVGQYTLAGQVTGRVTHSLGPMLFWLLALPSRFGGPASMAWTMGAVNTLAIV